MSITRYGEAQNPGPMFHIGTTNPGGIKGKEMIYGQLPMGTWGIAETHLAQPGLRGVRSAFQRAGREYQRTFSLLPGAMVSLRNRSDTTGTWSGVMTVSDAILRPIQVNWPNNEHACGRVQMVQCWWGPFALTGVTIYGWPSGPTHPHAVADTNALLETVVKELVISRTGPRYIVGDLNHPASQLPVLTILKSYGWQDVQELGFQRGSWTPIPTCKGSTTIDYVLISPELVPYYKQTCSLPWFADHVVLSAEFDLPVLPEVHHGWPQPSKIPWDHVNWQSWQHQTIEIATSNEMNLDDAYRHLWQTYENSFNGHMDTPDGLLPNNCKGRGQRDAPVEREAALPLLRPSRPGEVSQSTELLGRTPQRWFLQLRRLQSLLHGLRAGKLSSNAQIYRAELWGAIHRAKGFQGGFRKWWSTRPVQCQGSPPTLPQSMPSVDLLYVIFKDFELNYRKMESWHQRRRHELLDAYFRENQDKLFSLMKTSTKAPLQHLVDEQTVRVLAISADQQQVHVSEPITCTPSTICDIDGVEVTVESMDGPVLNISHEFLFTNPSLLTARTHHATPNAILDQFAQFWKHRWWRSNPPSTSDWARLFAFAEQYPPRKPMLDMDISSASWTEVNKRYTAKSARGPDAIDRRDLLWLHSDLTEALVGLLNRCEKECKWPSALLQGFVFPLPKRAEGTQVGDFRPVILYSMVYRSWSSLRARECLKHLASLTDTHQFGFLPGKEATEIWFTLQAYLEVCILQGEERCGWITDIQKAFENIPREPIIWLAIKLGIPSRVVNFWHNFLATTVRRFQCSGHVGTALMSNSGYPEGCAMSCFAMGLADLVFHLYLRAYAPVTIPISYVDNFELLASNCGQLQRGILCTEEWSQMWQMSLDREKSYVWATSARLRQQCQVLGWDLKETAVDLGANMVYGKKHRVAGAVDRMNSVGPLWELLKRLPAPEWEKLQMLRQCIWPKAFYGVANCPLGKKHVHDLRTAAARSLKRSRAGANPLLVLGLQSPMTSDPGFYQLWMVLQTFPPDDLQTTLHCGPLGHFHAQFHWAEKSWSVWQIT